MKQYVFLLIDDDIDDAELFQEALNETDSTIIFRHAENGEEALKNLDPFQLPELIFMDINMPRMNGWECLRLIKNNPVFQKIPVIVYSTSAHQEEIDNAVMMGALSLYRKPSTYSELKIMLSNVVAKMKTSSLETLQIITANSMH
ncbi:MAG TPA: response regulator [Bacteroidia bacterium]|jgi:CheY-like chemotaxis protein|nr:response regulator [Bacteroidia bacterium]